MNETNMLIIELVFLSLALWSAQAFDWHEADNGRVVWTNNCDFNGGDIGSRRSSGQNCATLCYRRQGCHRFAWTHHDGGTCWFKSGGGAPLYASNGGVCGYVYRWQNSANHVDTPTTTTRRPTSKRLRPPMRRRTEDFNPRNRCKTREECTTERVTEREATRFYR